MRCPACLQEVAETANTCGNCGTITISAQPKSPSPVGAAAAPGMSREPGAGRFVPGIVLGGRYRVIALAGRGGMGEVYRATDLLLNVPVALKFLPEAATNDDAALSRLYSEVRIAHQVSHPNICRVFDIFEAGPLRFISMEFIDGEDLRALLRQIRRVPADKAVEIARALCDGLQAAHDKGILHRDLKPSNIMIDGRGQVLIADFGLAGIAGQLNADSQSGTPQYMAPEQLAGSGVSVRSDLYSLGLVLYEMFTGRRAFEGRSPAELQKLQRIPPVPPRALVPDLDPVVEEIVLACLDLNPQRRPASAAAVAAALVHDDRVAATVAVGRTPPPEMLAASTQLESLPLGAAAACLAVIVAGLAGFVAVAEHANSSIGVPLTKSAEVLAYEASAKVSRLGYEDAPMDTAYGFTRFSDNTRSNRGRNFWYRQSATYFNVQTFRTPAAVTFVDPPRTSPGMIGMTLDASGNLRSFYAVSVPQTQSAGAQLDRQPAWPLLFKEAGFDFTSFSETEPESIPPVACDMRRAWTGTASGQAVRVEAALWRGRPVYFDVAGALDQAAASQPQPFIRGARAARVIIIFIFISTVVVAPLLARYHVRLKRADTRGAARLAMVVFTAEIVAWAFGSSHVPTFRELYLIVMGLSRALYSGAMTGILYLAFEPFVRKNWPKTLISWTRVLSGRFYDPLVGTHILIGVALAICLSALARAGMVWNGGQHLSTIVTEPSMAALLGGRHMVAQLVFYISDKLAQCMTVLFLVFFLRLLLRRTDLAGIAATVLMTAAFAGTGAGDPVIRAALMGTGTAAMMVVLARFGLLPLVAAALAASVLSEFPVTYKVSAWYSTASFTALAVVMVLAVFGFYAATVSTRKSMRTLLDAG